MLSSLLVSGPFLSAAESTDQALCVFSEMDDWSPVEASRMAAWTSHTTDLMDSLPTYRIPELRQHPVARRLELPPLV